MAPRKSRKNAKQRAAADDAITLVQAEAHAQTVRETVDPAALKQNLYARYNMDAAARVAYESFIRQLGFKIGQKVSDASGLHRIPAWDQHKSFVKVRWRAVAQAVIDAAIGKLA